MVSEQQQVVEVGSKSSNHGKWFYLSAVHGSNPSQAVKARKLSSCLHWPAEADGTHDGLSGFKYGADLCAFHTGP